MLANKTTLMMAPEEIQRLNIPFTRLKIHLRARDTIRLPSFPGSVFRGSFGAALRRSCCATGLKSCEECLVKTVCVYAAAFETTAEHVGGGRHQLREYPRPFVLEPPFPVHRAIQPGESFFCSLVLIGKAIEWLPYFTHALIEMGRGGIGSSRGTYRVVNINSDFDDQQEIVFDGEARRFSSPPPEKSMAGFFDRQSSVVPRVFVQFQTPVRIKHENRLSAALDFEMFMRNLLRRISLMVEICTGKTWNMAFRSFLEEAGNVRTKASHLRWYDWERYSSRQRNPMKLGGIVGDICFEGDLSPFMPFLRIGEHIHVGKAVTFGLGKYDIEILNGCDSKRPS